MRRNPVERFRRHIGEVQDDADGEGPPEACRSMAMAAAAMCVPMIMTVVAVMLMPVVVMMVVIRHFSIQTRWTARPLCYTVT